MSTNSCTRFRPIIYRVAIEPYPQWYYYLADHDWIWTTYVGYTNDPRCYNRPGNSDITYHLPRFRPLISLKA
jgi:hypothetical protein